LIGHVVLYQAVGMEATFRLARQTGGRGHWAEATVTVVPAARSEVASIGDDAFAWRLDVYGPGARYGGSFDAEWAAAARQGAEYALACLPASTPPVRVTVTSAKDAPADTTFSDMKFATAQAVWSALDFRPSHEPTLRDGEWNFP
jgi:hypothetical protein